MLPDLLPQLRPALRARTAALTLATALAAAAGAAALAPTPASASTPALTTTTYDTPGSGALTVPPGVYRVLVTAAGGAGGDGNGPTPCVHGAGGPAGEVGGYVDVEPGDTISYVVAGGGHLTGAGGYGALLGGGHGGSNDGGGIASIGGNGGGGGGATSVSVDGTQVLVAGGGGGGGGRGTSALVCGGDGGSGGQPPTRGYNGTIGGQSYGAGGTIDALNTETDGADPAGGSGGGGGGGGGDGVQPGGGGGADQSAVGGGGGGGGAGGSSVAYPLLHGATFTTTGSHGSDGFVTLSWGTPTTTSVPDVSGPGAGTVTLHAVVYDIDGGGTVAFTYPTPSLNGVVLATPVPGCTSVPLTGVGDGVTFEASCDVATRLLPADTVTATYSGDAAYQPSNGTGHVTVAPSPSTTSLAADPASGQPGESTQLTATVSADGGGTVTFLDENGQAVCSGSELAPPGATTASATCFVPITSGTHTFTATYSGDRDFATSSSSPVTVTATPTTPTTPIPPTNEAAAVAPGAPTIGTISAGDGSVTVTFTAPQSDGGSPVTGYTATASPVGGGTPVTATGGSSPITLTGLTDGTVYTVTVVATNAVGTSPSSAPTDRVTPAAPAAPLRVDTTTLPAATAHQAYSATLDATGGAGRYTWKLARGSHLPAGLRLHADGTLTGRPRSAGARTITVVVTDHSSPAKSATAQLRLTVAPAPAPDLAVTLTPIGGLVHGSSGSYRVTVTNTGTAATRGRTVVSLSLGRGLRVQGATAPGWTCTAHGLHCTRRAALAAGASTGYTVQVHVDAAAGARVTSRARVWPTDRTPCDNRGTATATVHAS